MLLKDYKVKIPEGARIQKKDNCYYVYVKTDYVYRKDKGYSFEKRVCIGKKIDEEYMIPNEKYSEYFSDLELKLSEAPEFSDTLKIGNIILFDKIAKDLELEELLEAAHKEKKDTLFNMVSYMLIKESSAFQYYPDFAYDHNIRGRIYSDSFLSKYLKTFSDEEMELFLKGWNTLHNKEMMIYLNYDASNSNSNAQGIQLLEYGHSKKDNDLRQVNYSYASLAEDATPLFYEIYPGSIVDNAELRSMALKAKEYGYTDIGFILDRGYYSKGNISYLEEKGYSYILMIKDNNSFVKMFKQEMNTMISGDYEYYIDEYSLYGKTFRSKLFQSDKRSKYIHVYFDEARASLEKDMILSNISKMENTLDSILKGDDISFKKKEKCDRFSKYFNLHYKDGYLTSFSPKKAEIQKLCKNCGFFALVTSEEYTAKQALFIYRSRDSVEKLFMILKSFLDMDALRVYTDRSLKAKFHISFIASIIRNHIYKKMNELKKEYKDRKYYTVPSVIKELEKIECTRNTNGIYQKKYILTARQKKILKPFGIDDKYIEEQVKKINRQMKELYQKG